MFFNWFGQFNMGCFMGGFNNMFFPQPFLFNQFPQFPMPVFNFMPVFQPINNIWNTPVFSIKSSPNTDTFTRTTSPLDNYNATKGNLLANIAAQRAVGEVGYCAKFVQEAISIAGLGACTGANAFEMADTLRLNPNFREISKDEVDINSLPAGCILVYDKCTRHPDEIYGHIEFTRGNGEGISDGISKSLHPNPSAVFIPV